MPHCNDYDRCRSCGDAPCQTWDGVCIHCTSKEPKYVAAHKKRIREEAPAREQRNELRRIASGGGRSW